MHALPFVVALATAAVLSGPLLAQMRRSGAVRPNYRSRELPFPFGVLVLAAAAIALIPLMLLQRLGETQVFTRPVAPILVYCLGVIVPGAAGRHARGGGRGAGRGRSVGMRERVALLGGRLAIESRPGAGTTFVAEVPLT